MDAENAISGKGIAGVKGRVLRTEDLEKRGIDVEKIMVDINKPLKAKAYGFDKSWYEPDGEDDRGEYIITDVQGVMFPSGPYQKQTEIMTSGGRYDNFCLLPQE